MNILIAGASGFIGTELTHYLSPKHTITVLGRTLEKLESSFPNDIPKLTWDTLQAHNAKRYDLVINVSGYSIGDKRWSAPIKKVLMESRTKTNQQLIEWLIKHDAKPRFFCANAVGIYGTEDISTDAFDETSPLPLSSHDFLQQIGLAWEQSLKPAIDAGIPVTTLRFGVVLKKNEGMLKKLELPFRLGLGSILGSGNQVLSWVYYKDLIHAIDFLIEHPNVTGPINITSPYPVAQRVFARELANVLKRPLFLKMPKLIVTLLFGEMGEYLLLKGQRVLPKRLDELGFTFAYPNVESALVEAFKKPQLN